jgi:hypothetical protein
MSLEVDVISEMWLTCKEYIAGKDPQSSKELI